MRNSYFLSISEVAKRLNVSEMTLRRWDDDGKLKATRRSDGNQRQYDSAEIDAYISNYEFLCKECHTKVQQNQVRSHDHFIILFREELCPDCDETHEHGKYAMDDNKCKACHTSYGRYWLFCPHCHAPFHFKYQFLTFQEDRLSNKEILNFHNCYRCQFFSQKRDPKTQNKLLNWCAKYQFSFPRGIHGSEYFGYSTGQWMCSEVAESQPICDTFLRKAE